ncbi:MAG: GNAT family N-acetyltransferase [Pseudomonadota bacterium]
MICVQSLPEPHVLARLHEKCFERPWSAKSFGALLAMPGVTALVASREDEPVGLVLTRQAGDEAEILTIGVLHQARRQGVARRMLEQIISRSAGLASIFIEVDVANDHALWFYEDAGFRTTGRRRDYYQLNDGSRSDALIMRLELASTS